MLFSTLRSTATTFLLSVALLYLPIVSAQHDASSRPANDTASICRPFGECEPCPPEALKEPFCQPFGNRRLLHCLPPSPPPSSSHPTHPDPSPERSPENLGLDRPPGRHSQTENRPHVHDSAELFEGETVAWESCGRIVAQERADFWEFVACNVLFVGIALGLVLMRSRRMSTMQARQLAARIGLARGYG
ncbi:hypothetical protein BC834DRAFT_332802 [Gloeopeniophorella convolvens]|nr:hypothetical protein BC834DRAFT_332802 [Gloeopeniophorella convolvens]